MKKLLALTVVFLLSISAFAQNVAQVTASGNNNVAFVDQIGGVPVSNHATINQIGNNNVANQSDLYASSLFGLLTGTKGISQNGSGHTGTINQTNLHAGVVNAGPIAGIGQTNSGNTATITQSGNTAWMQSYAWAKQTGVGNTSTQEQLRVSYQFSHVYQTGDANTATTTQDGGYNQKANILQTGDHNIAVQEQGLAGYTQSNLAEATQSGDYNDAKQDQNGSSNTSRLIQSGDYNHALLIQDGNTNLLRVEQKTGAYNKVDLTQSDMSTGDILQDGSFNKVKGIGVDMASSLEGSFLNVDQVGSNNTLQLYQTNGATSTVSQTGSFNSAVVNQQ